MVEIPDMKKLAAPRCGNCKYGYKRGSYESDGFLCRRFPPTVQMVPLVPVAVLPYAIGVRPLPTTLAEEIKRAGELADAVGAAQRSPMFYPVISFPGVSGSDWCGEHKPALLEEMN